MTYKRAHLIAENNTNTRDTVEELHLVLQGRSDSEIAGDIIDALSESAPNFYPIKRIVDLVYFAGKRGAFLLQLADVCAFIIRCFIEQKPRALSFAEILTADNTSVLHTGDSPAGFEVINFTSVV
jgi:hypothetical protein